MNIPWSTVRYSKKIPQGNDDLEVIGRQEQAANRFTRRGVGAVTEAAWEACGLPAQFPKSMG